jgi:hypothetical protein
MRQFYLVVLGTLLAVGCGSKEEVPNPLEKADVPLPIVTMPLGSFPSKAEKPSRLLLKEKLIAGTEIAVEGSFEVADPETYQPQQILVEFIIAKNNRRITANGHIGGKPVRAEGNQFRYRTVIKAPETPRRYLLEVHQLNERKDLIAAAEIVVEKVKK